MQENKSGCFFSEHSVYTRLENNKENFDMHRANGTRFSLSIVLCHRY